MKILVIDDSDFIRLTLANILRSIGHQVFEAKNGEEARRKYPEVHPDLVFLDLLLPGEKGQDILKDLKSINPQVKVIICSSIANQDDIIKEVIDLGAIDVITKPFQRDEIVALVNKNL